jgi:hypothetical protein
MATHQLPHMTADDLERFIGESTDELGLTPADATCFRVRRRRRSLEMALDRDGTIGGGFDDGPFRHVKVVAVGDDLPCKLKLLQLFMAGGAAGAKQPPVNLGVNRKAMTVKTDAGAAAWDVELWVPETSDLARHSRREAYHGADAVVIAFSVKHRASFEHARDVWAAEWADALAARAGGVSTVPCDVPVILVGLEAESRGSKAAPVSVAVPAVEAVQLAQDIGATKYMEVFSDNAFHVTELFTQAVATTEAARAAAGVPAAMLAEQHQLHAAAFGEHLSLPPPDGTFDLVRRCFVVSGGAAGVDTAFDVTVDGSDPLTSATRARYSGPLEFQRPFPKTVRVVATARCRYASEVASFAVPAETPAPSGFFDVCTKTVHMLPSAAAGDDGDGGYGYRGDVQLRYTTDGSDPTAHSAAYTAPLSLDAAGRPLAAWGGARPAPKVFKLIAVAAGSFRSRVVVLEAPPLLDAPRVHYNAHDGTMQVEGASSAIVDYRYTIDGSPPTFQSTLYTRPVMLPKNKVDVRTIRVAAFPRLSLPSAEAVVEIGATARADAAANTFGTTRSTMSRIAQSHREHRDPAPKSPRMMAPGSRAATSRYMSPAATQRAAPDASRRTKSPAPRLAAAPAVRPSPAARSSAATTPVRAPMHRSPTTHRSVLSTTPASGLLHSPASPSTVPIESPRAAPASPPAACSADDNTVNFDFKDPISLSHITVATPGGGKGPAMYEVFALHEGVADPAPVLVGGGRLDDFDGVQTLHVQPGARLLPIRHVQCVFVSATDGDELFQINDLKIHGKPFLAGRHALN